jgi:putative ABC transport system permease protein
MTLLQDVRHGFRLLMRSPAFTIVAVAALAIGIAANTAIFSVINTLLLKRLPYEDPDRLAVIWERNIPRDRKTNPVGPANYMHWRDANQVFTDIAALTQTFNRTLTGAGEPEEIPAQFVARQFFAILGVQPALGRTFTEEEGQPGHSAVIISDRLWKRRFNGDPSILQQPIMLLGQPYLVVGVMPPGFSFLDKTVDLWSPLTFTAQSRIPRGRGIVVVGRLKPDVTFARAQEDMTRVHAELTRMFPEFDTGWTANVVPLREQLTGDVRPALFVLLGAVVFVLLIACANVANLLLARATARQRELAVRSALGAGRGRLVRQLLAESLLLAAAGGATGLLLAWWALRFLRLVVAARLPIQRLELVGLDPPVLIFTLGVSLLSGLIFGIVPALTSSADSLTNALKEGGRTGSAARGNRTRSTFVVVEIALALVLLVGAGLLMRSFRQLLDVDPGFKTANTVTMRVSLPPSRYPANPNYIQFYERLFTRIDALPGVQAAGATSTLPLIGLGSATSFIVVDKPKPPMGQEPVADVRVITHDYLKAMGIPLLKGRLFNEHDPADAKDRVVVNETLAHKYWPGQDALGKRMRISWDDNRDDEIIGIVGDAKHAGLDVQARPTTYWPYARNVYGSMTIAIRTAGDPSAVVNAVTGLIHDQDAQLAVADVKTMDEVVANSLAERRLLMLLLTIFASAALMLAAVGIYGVIAYSVTQRTQEIGIRMALGAQQQDVLRMIVGHAVMLAVVGMAIGSAVALLLTRLMTGLLYATAPTDPATFLAVATVLGAVAVLASYLPGRRATRVDPVIALRSE